jgi:predicted MFS family arabinose efflux permease
VLLAVVPTTATMLAVQPLIAVSFSLSFVGQSRLLAASVPADQQSSAQTLGSAVSFGFGSLLAGVLGGHLADAAGYGALFAAMGVVSLAGAGIGVIALWRSRGRAAQEVTPRAGA